MRIGLGLVQFGLKALSDERFAGLLLLRDVLISNILELSVGSDLVFNAFSEGDLFRLPLQEEFGHALVYFL